MSGSESPESEKPVSAGPTPSDAEIPPLDVVNSRWWYWIVAYPVVTFLFIPLILIFGVIGLAPFVVISPDPQPQPLLAVVFGIIGLIMVLLILVLIFASLAVLVMLPVALYMDSRAVSRADYEWKPEPLLYGVLGVLQFLVTPLIGLIVALYYLYRRHEHVGIP